VFEWKHFKTTLVLVEMPRPTSDFAAALLIGLNRPHLVHGDSISAVLVPPSCHRAIIMLVRRIFPC